MQERSYWDRYNLALPFIDEILSCNSLSIIGMAKNTGKTETLNSILYNLDYYYPQLSIGLTSIGLDGEIRDQVTQTDKPEVYLEKGTFFVTAEYYYNKKQLSAEVASIDRVYSTSIGKLIYARVMNRGKVIIAGPATTGGLKKVISEMALLGATLTIIDGALSRVSLASPSVADGLILATGAALSPDPNIVIEKTKDLVQQINLPRLSDLELIDNLDKICDGIRIITEYQEIFDPNVSSAMGKSLSQTSWWKAAKGTLYVPGLVNDTVLNLVMQHRHINGLIFKDFTKLFVSRNTLRFFLNKGKSLHCLHKTKLVGITFNPQSPQGFRMNSSEMCKRLSDALDIRVSDVRRSA